MEIWKAKWRQGKRPRAESICTTTAGRTQAWEWRHRKRCIPAPGNIEMKFSFPALRADSLRSPARSAGKEAKNNTTTNNQTKSTKFISGLDQGLEVTRKGGKRQIAGGRGIGNDLNLVRETI